MRVLLAVLMALLAMPLAAQDAMPPAPYAYRQLEDPALEARAQGLMETLRCLTCQSQSHPVANTAPQVASIHPAVKVK